MLTVEVVEHDPRARCYVGAIRSVLCWSYPRLANRSVGTWTVSVLCAGSAEISHLHHEFFGDSSGTDVMSFPSGVALGNTEGYLGDIAISMDVAAIQAIEQNHSIEHEISYLALHGLLHLLGYRDDDDEQRAQMLAQQDALFASWRSDRMGAG